MAKIVTRSQSVRVSAQILTEGIVWVDIEHELCLMDHLRADLEEPLVKSRREWVL